MGIPIPQEIFLSGGLERVMKALRDPLSREYQELQQACYPVFVKPSQGDNSFGIHGNNICHRFEDAVAVIEAVFLECPTVDDVVVQEYLTGGEFSIGMVGNVGSMAYLPILEVDFSKIEARKLPPILGYESKWDPESPYWTEIEFHAVDSDAEDDLEPTAATAADSRINGACEIREKMALKGRERSPVYRDWKTAKVNCERLFHRLELLDYGRFDFRCDARGNLKLLEVNPNPGWCWDGKMAHMAEKTNVSYSQLVGTILVAACDRFGY